MGYATPRTLSDAVSLLAHAPGAMLVAGGTDFFPALGEATPPADLIDLSRVAELHGITASAEGWRIGARATWSDVIHADLPPCFDALKAAARTVGSVQIQNAGTLAGNLCNASPAADGVPPLLALDARVALTGPEGSRVLPLSAFLLGVRKTALAPGEILSAIHIPPQLEGAVSAFEKLGSRKYLVISIVMVAANLWLHQGRIAGARIAVGAASPVAQRLPALEAALIGRPAKATGPFTAADHVKHLTPIDDIRGSAAYRAEVIGALCDRAIQRALVHG